MSHLSEFPEEKEVLMLPGVTSRVYTRKDREEEDPQGVRRRAAEFVLAFLGAPQHPVDFTLHPERWDPALQRRGCMCLLL